MQERTDGKLSDYLIRYQRGIHGKQQPRYCSPVNATHPDSNAGKTDFLQILVELQLGYT
jgi:hypothetical protein